MGDPKKLRKKYSGPRHPWQGIRIKEEKELIRSYGIKNKKEIWKTASRVRQWRQQARKITEMRGKEAEAAEKILLSKLQKLGILDEKANLENVLDLKIQDLLERRLQTQVFKKGLASSMKQARQYIVHEKVMVNNEIITSPSYITKVKDIINLTPEFIKQLKSPKKKKIKKEITEESSETEDEVKDGKE